MFEMFEFLWKKKEPPSPAETPKQAVAPNTQQGVAPGTQLHYDPNLVPSLIADHHVLVGIFGEIGNALKQKDSVLLKEKLSEFGGALRGHLLTENIKFYVYLQHSLEGDAENAAIMHDFRKEMQHIGKAVADFLHKYVATTDWNDAAWQSFETDVTQIGKVLVKRIQTEEQVLYSLYLPPEEYK